MDIDRINQAPGSVKVERVGSEQQRRRRQQDKEDFAQLLETSIEETDETPDNLPVRQSDTVSITGGSAAAKAVLNTPDTVDISAKSRITAESNEAKNGALAISLAQKLALTVKQHAPEQKPATDRKLPPAEDTEATSSPGSVDKTA